MFAIFTTVVIVFWDVTLCGLVGRYQKTKNNSNVCLETPLIFSSIWLSTPPFCRHLFRSVEHDKTGHTPFRHLIQNRYAAYFEFLRRHWRNSRHGSVASTRQLSATIPLRQHWITCWLQSAEWAPCLLAQICVTANSAAHGWRHSLFCCRSSCLRTLK
jgi:hypothetical protein